MGLKKFRPEYQQGFRPEYQPFSPSATTIGAESIRSLVKLRQANSVGEKLLISEKEAGGEEAALAAGAFPPVQPAKGVPKELEEFREGWLTELAMGLSAAGQPGASDSFPPPKAETESSFGPRAGAPTPKPRAPPDDPGPAAEPPMDDVSEQLRITGVQIVVGAKNQPEPTMLGAAQAAAGGRCGAYKSLDEEEEEVPPPVSSGNITRCRLWWRERFLGEFLAQAGSLRAAAATPLTQRCGRPDPAGPAPPLQQETPSSHGEQLSSGFLGFGLDRSDETKGLKRWAKEFLRGDLKRQAWCLLRPGGAPGEQTSEAVTCALHSGPPSKSYISEAAREGRPCGGAEADEPEELWLRISRNTKPRQHTAELVIAEEFHDAAVYIVGSCGGRRLPSAEVAAGGSGGLDFPLAAIEGVFPAEQLLLPDHMTPMAAAAAAARRDLGRISGLSGRWGQVLGLRVRKPCSKGRSSTNMAAPPSDGDGEGSFSVFLLGPPPAEEAEKIREPSGPTRLRGAGEVSVAARSGNWDPGLRRLDSALRLLSGRDQLYFAVGILQGIAKAKKASCREAAGAGAAVGLRQRHPHQWTPLL